MVSFKSCVLCFFVSCGCWRFWGCGNIYSAEVGMELLLLEYLLCLAALYSHVLPYNQLVVQCLGPVPSSLCNSSLLCIQFSWVDLGHLVIICLLTLNWSLYRYTYCYVSHISYMAFSSRIFFCRFFSLHPLTIPLPSLISHCNLLLTVQSHMSFCPSLFPSYTPPFLCCFFQFCSLYLHSSPLIYLEPLRSRMCIWERTSANILK